jgi:hypothetical protein
MSLCRDVLHYIVQLMAARLRDDRCERRAGVACYAAPAAEAARMGEGANVA